MTNTIARRIAYLAALFVAATCVAGQGVSPGRTDAIANVEARCPTFSWETTPETDYYEVVAYAFPRDLADEAVLFADLSVASEVLYEQVPGGAGTWTPSGVQCLTPGSRYAWFVRAVAVDGDTRIEELAEWSLGLYFRIPATPSVEDVRHALTVLERWQASGPEQETPEVQPATRSRASRPGGSLKSVPTAPAAIRGEHPGHSGENYGVVGISGSPSGAGVAAVNTSGGADLVLDGSEDGASDTRISEWGIDRPSTAQETFEITNSGSGRLHLDIEGDMTADIVRTEEVVVNGMTVIDDSGDWLGNGSTIPCSACVSTSDLADNVITSRKIQDGQVGTADLGSSAVTSAKIADGTITAADIDPSAALDADTLDGQHGAYYRNASNVNAGTLPTGYYSARNDLDAEGYLGNASGDIAQNNGTRQVDLNADRLDGMEGSSFQKEIVIEWADSGYGEVYVDDCTTVIEISVTAPGTGTLLLDAFATAAFEHTLGTTDYLKISFEETEDSCPFSVPRQQILSIPDDLPTRTAWPEYIFPIAVNLDTWVASGTHTFYLNAKMVDGGAFETDYLTHINVRAMFIPD
jgi:hypothetical protein